MTRTFTKMFGLGGMRVGWCYGPPAVIDVLNRVRSAVQRERSPAQAAAIAALAEPGWVEKGRAAQHANTAPGWPARLRRRRHQGLAERGQFRAGRFRHAGAGRRRRTRSLQGARRDRARRWRGYGLPQCLRITVGTAEEVRAGHRGAGRVHGGAGGSGAWLNRCSGAWR